MNDYELEQFEKLKHQVEKDCRFKVVILRLEIGDWRLLRRFAGRPISGDV